MVDHPRPDRLLTAVNVVLPTALAAGINLATSTNSLGVWMVAIVLAGACFAAQVAIGWTHISTVKQRWIGGTLIALSILLVGITGWRTADPVHEAARPSTTGATMIGASGPIDASGPIG